VLTLPVVLSIIEDNEYPAELGTPFVPLYANLFIHSETLDPIYWFLWKSSFDCFISGVGSSMCLSVIKFPSQCFSYLPDMGTLLEICSILCW
jgi:hypothetical protein